DPLLLGERLARERLVASREGELRAALPSPGLGVELLDLAAKLLLGGDGAHHLATRRAQLLLHLVDDVRDGATRVVDAIEQCIEVARDDAAHAIEDPHGTRECATPGWRGPPSGPAPSLFSAYPPPGSPRPPLPRLSPLCDGRRATGVRCASAIERPAPHPLWNPLLACARGSGALARGSKIGKGSGRDLSSRSRALRWLVPYPVRSRSTALPPRGRQRFWM